MNTTRDWKSKKGMSQTLIAKVIAKGSGCDTGLRYGGCVGVEADAGLHSRLVWIGGSEDMYWQLWGWPGGKLSNKRRRQWDDVCVCV